MATVQRYMPVAPEAVWDALADPGGYGYWVLGSKVIRDAAVDGPAAGARFHHTVGGGPLKISDHTESPEASPPALLRLRAKARPLGTARVTLPGPGTVVRMTETPDGPTAMPSRALAVARADETARRRVAHVPRGARAAAGRVMSVRAATGGSVRIETAPPQPELLAGRDNPEAALLDPNRLNVRASATGFVRENVVVARFV